MDQFKIEHDIHVCWIAATSFPEGIKQAHDALRRSAPMREGRNYYGISYPDRTGNIIYKAAATEISPGELSNQNLEQFVIPAGEYLRIVIEDYSNNVSAISDAFDAIVAQPNIDQQGFCLEWYINDNDVWCMVRTAGS